jgi:GxxExxY protein
MINRLDTSKTADEALAQRVVGLAMKVHRTLGCGFIESVYANALLIELRKAGIAHEREKTFPVIYDGVEVGVFQADLFIEERLIVELKAVEALAVAHSVQLVNYLAAAKVDFGLLLNFGAKSLGFRTKTRFYQQEEPPPPNLQS